jgi:hypothetical protein
MRRDHPETFAKLVFDETDYGNDSARSKAIRKFMHSTDEGRCWAHVLDVPFFVSSVMTPGIQLADLIAGAVRHHQILRDRRSGWLTEWEAAIKDLADLAAAKSSDFVVGSETYYGLYTMPDRYYARPPRHRAF